MEAEGFKKLLNSQKTPVHQRGRRRGFISHSGYIPKLQSGKVSKHSQEVSEIFIQPCCGLIQSYLRSQNRARGSLGNLQNTN